MGTIYDRFLLHAVPNFAKDFCRRSSIDYFRHQGALDNLAEPLVFYRFNIAFAIVVDFNFGEGEAGEVNEVNAVFIQLTLLSLFVFSDA